VVVLGGKRVSRRAGLGTSLALALISRMLMRVLAILYMQRNLKGRVILFVRIRRGLAVPSALGRNVIGREVKYAPVNCDVFSNFDHHTTSPLHASRDGAHPVSGGILVCARML